MTTVTGSLNIGLDSIAQWKSLVVLFYGLQPSDHESVAHTSTDDEHYAMPDQTDASPLLPETLDAAGYGTYSGAAFITPHLALQGWYQTHRVYGDARAETVLQDYVDWRAGPDRTFGYLHFGNLHAPIEPPAEYTDKLDVDLSLPEIRHIRRYGMDFDSDDPDCHYYREQKLLLYQAALNYISDQLTPILEGYRDDTSVFVIGDYGEPF